MNKRQRKKQDKKLRQLCSSLEELTNSMKGIEQAISQFKDSIQYLEIGTITGDEISNLSRCVKALDIDYSSLVYKWFSNHYS